MADSVLQLRTFDARPDRLDLRDLTYRPRVASLPPEWPEAAVVKAVFPQYYKDGLILDQGQEGACTGFGLACVVNYLLWRRRLASQQSFESVSPRMLYHLARFYDEWPGEDYDGSSCRGALKAWHKHGVCSERLWPYRSPDTDAVEFVAPAPGWQEDAAGRPLGVYYRVNKASVVDIQAAIYEVGAVYVAASVHDGWTLKGTRPRTMSHAVLPLIASPQNSNETGGHAFALVGYNERGFVVQNSWGPGWGARGFAVLPYEDWVAHGDDAWVCALGVPTAQARAQRHFVRSAAGAAVSTPAGGTLWAPERPPTDFDYHDYPAVQPWSSEQAYCHTLVTGNNGRLINRIVEFEDAAVAVHQLVVEKAGDLLRGVGEGRPKRLVVYAHGGLNSEGESIRRIRILAPYFAANGVYPLFLTWKTGPVESGIDILQDEVAKAFGLAGGLKERVSEALDRGIEVVCENSPVKSLWTQMKQNAREWALPGRGGDLLARALSELLGRVGPVELHLVGHSAGSIILGHLLDGFGALGLRAASTTLYAPACTVDFANAHYRPAIDGGVLADGRLYIHLLADARERADRVGPYGKSLLYLVSRALEDAHKTPILGLDRVFAGGPPTTADDAWADETRDGVTAWQAFWNGLPEAHRYVLDAAEVSNGPRTIPAAHGCFDNDVEVIAATIRRITGEVVLHHPVVNLNY